MNYLEITSLMVYFIESSKIVTSHGKLIGLLIGISLGPEDGTAMGSSVRDVEGGINISNFELVIWVL